MRTTANYIHMHILFLNMQALDVGLKLNIAVFYNGTARCYKRPNWWSSSTDMGELWQHWKFGRHSQVAAYLSRNSSII